ncbi:hypothetical protein FGF1_27380 [Flavobacteriaceae bacterium GF1]
MKKTILTLTAFLLLLSLNAQQWTGPDGGNTITTSYNVGIGTVSPGYALDVYGASEGLRLGDSGNFILFRNNTGGTNEIRSYGLGLEIETRNSQDILFNSNNGSSRLMTIKGDGSGIGIGTSNPTSNFDVYKFDGSSHARIYTNQHNGIAKLEIAGGVASFGPSYSGWSLYHSFNHTGKDLYVRYGQSGNPNFVFKDEGALGIGTTSTGSHKLAVEGSIGAREIKVQASGWSDFVFHDDYKLATLQEVEAHIQEKGHLQDIPSAQEVMENGIQLGEMNAKLLQKIEELMLYTIAQQKEIQKLKEEVKVLREGQK